MKVTLREKPIKGDTMKSLYLDYYPPLTHPVTGKKTRREFLQLYLYTKPKSKQERELNKMAKDQAEIIWHTRQGQMIKRDFSFLTGEDANDVESMIQELIDETSNPTSLRHYSCLADMIKQHAGTDYLTFSMFTPEFCQGYINALRTRKTASTWAGTKEAKDKVISQNTAATYSVAFIKFINRAESRDKVINISKKIKGIQPDKATKRNFLSLQQLEALANTPVDRRHFRCKDACFFSSSTGLRIGDILNLKWNDIIREDGKHYIYFNQQKGRKSEYFPLNIAAVALLGEEKTGKVFQGVSQGKIKYLLKYWIPEAGIDTHITFHSFRHTFASLLVKKGVNMAVIMGLLGHKDISTTMRYSHIGTEEKQEAVNRLDK